MRQTSLMALPVAEKGLSRRLITQLPSPTLIGIIFTQMPNPSDLEFRISLNDPLTLVFLIQSSTYPPPSIPHLSLMCEDEGPYHPTRKQGSASFLVGNNVLIFDGSFSLQNRIHRHCIHQTRHNSTKPIAFHYYQTCPRVLGFYHVRLSPPTPDLPSLHGTDALRFCEHSPQLHYPCPLNIRPHDLYYQGAKVKFVTGPRIAQQQGETTQQKMI